MDNPLDSLLPSDLIDTKAAAKICGGTHMSTIRRWILSGKLRGYKMAGNRFLVSRADVLNLIQPYKKHVPEQPPTKRERTAQQKWTESVLKEHGLA